MGVVDMEILSHVEMYTSNHGYLDGKEIKIVRTLSFVLFTILVHSLGLVRQSVFW
jgi:hypothetical protein